MSACIGRVEGGRTECMWRKGEESHADMQIKWGPGAHTPPGRGEEESPSRAGSDTAEAHACTVTCQVKRTHVDSS